MLASLTKPQGIAEASPHCKPEVATAVPSARVAATLKAATDRDLLLLRAAIDRRLLDPVRVERIRQCLTIGTQVSYLSTARHLVLTGKVLDVSDERVMIQASDGQLRWLHFAAVVLDDAMAPQPRARFAPGDHVSFEDRKLVHRFGTVVRVNPKTVTVLCDGRQQRIKHADLSRVVDI
ncbi:MAG: hypothetical protein ACKVQQ_14040 [Burkholderiales bacterium]